MPTSSDTFCILVLVESAIDQLLIRKNQERIVSASTSRRRRIIIFWMKLSFAFSKTAAPKKKAVIQQPEKPIIQKREVVALSQDSGLVVQKSDSDIIDDLEPIINVKTHYTRPSRRIANNESDPRTSLRHLENKPGIISGSKREHVVTSDKDNMDLEEVQEPKRRPRSILMQIKDAREKGFIRDAPDVQIRQLDPDQFGWALLRGMGYDPSTEPSTESSAQILGNRAKSGIGATSRLP